MTDKWIGKVAVVTGASAGIGASIFRDFAKIGIIAIGLARRVEKIEEIIKELGDAKAYAFKCDISNEMSVTETFKAIEEKFGIVHILINSAAISARVMILDDKEESYNKMNEILDLNVRGLTQCTREAFRLMKKSDDYGMIINLNSVFCRHIPFTGVSMNMYGASKQALTALSEIMRQELIIQNNHKIRVATVSPGYVFDTEFVAKAGFTREGSSVIKGIPFISCDDITQSIMYLLSTGYKVNVTELTIRPVGEKF